MRRSPLPAPAPPLSAPGRPRRLPARRLSASAPTAVAAAALLLLASPAAAHPAVPADKPQVLSRWTQAAAASQDAWLAARAHRSDWAAYGFDWSTDYCTTSPDNPFGFPFRAACARHDFGYRNYRAAGAFQPNKSRLDAAFHADLERVCARYSGARKASCDGTAWTYYQAVRAFGAAAETGPAQPPAS
ncbi:phospholipase [Streptomyces sp. NPDC006670]|uniref:phospholipase n=1 Tax=Streptomyces sp. NPDC006670 TaxID=3154476 RepID=UPI00340E29F4